MSKSDDLHCAGYSEDYTVNIVNTQPGGAVTETLFVFGANPILSKRAIRARCGCRQGQGGQARSVHSISSKYSPRSKISYIHSFVCDHAVQLEQIFL
eukprot:6203318-Pleurochrysis_carterae.AAC.5